MSNNPYGDALGNISGGAGGGGGREAAKKKMLGPAIGLIVVGVLTIIYALYGGVMGALTLAGMNPMAAMQEQQFQQMEQMGQPAEQIAMARQINQITAGPGAIVIALIALVCGVIIMLGAMKMMKLESRGLSMTSAVLGIIPCTSACCILGLPFGIWAIISMNDPNVRQYFK